MVTGGAEVNTVPRELVAMAVMTWWPPQASPHQSVFGGKGGFGTPGCVVPIR